MNARTDSAHPLPPRDTTWSIILSRFSPVPTRSEVAASDECENPSAKTGAAVLLKEPIINPIYISIHHAILQTRVEWREANKIQTRIKELGFY